MEILTKELNKYLYRYFNTLSKLGYFKYNDVYKLIIISFLEEVLNGKLVNSITEEEYRLITNCINNMLGTSCLINFPKYDANTILPKNYIYKGFRYTEDDIMRESEDSRIRSI